MMKKTVMMVAAAMGISSLAFAANPFSDVPQGHWAYASFAQLSGSGILEAYPDSTFAGERTMTRYEMAQIVAKALAKGAIGADDRLVAEFAEELDQLGVRVAALEKQANRVKITGRIRLNYRERSGKFHEDSDAKLRTRLYLTGEVNDTLQFVSMIQNQQYFLQGKNESGDSAPIYRDGLARSRSRQDAIMTRLQKAISMITVLTALNWGLIWAMLLILSAPMVKWQVQMSVRLRVRREFRLLVATPGLPWAANGAALTGKSTMSRQKMS